VENILLFATKEGVLTEALQIPIERELHPADLGYRRAEIYQKI
jgi:hypothetical protein